MHAHQPGQSQFNLPRTTDQMIQVINVDDDRRPKYPVVSMIKPGSTHQVMEVINLDGDDEDGSLISIKETMMGNKGKRKKLCSNDVLQQEIINVDEDDDSVKETMDVNGKLGKKPCNYVLQQVINIVDEDYGSSSRSSSSSSLVSIKECSKTSEEYLFYCTICMETVPVRKRFSIAGCTHAFCVRCVEQYITAKVQESVLPIGCPEPGCEDGELHPEACRYVVRHKVFDRWGAALCEKALGALKFYCPYKDCSALLVDDDPEDAAAPITIVDCPHCRRIFCAQCKVPWHDGVSCAEFQRLGQDERGLEDLLLKKVAKERRWQRCPRCKMYVEKASGCAFIICRCSHSFCYQCGSTATNHHCKRCSNTG